MFIRRLALIYMCLVLIKHSTIVSLYLHIVLFRLCRIGNELSPRPKSFSNSCIESLFVPFCCSDIEEFSKDIP